LKIILRRKRVRTARVRAQDTAALAARLLNSQEEERRRVSRDLHDGICQQLASLAIEIGRVAQTLPDDVRHDLLVLQSRAIQAAAEARHIAYELHPSILDDLGIVAGLQNLCKQFYARHGIAIRFRHGKLPASVPSETGSCLYRIAQQSLENVAQHSGATRVMVALRYWNGNLMLLVRDNGVGFDRESVRGKGSLGLIGMEERVRLVNGKLTISPRLGWGTRIAIQIPLPADS
jgi:two-component system NarL family sensor kinase